jgi:hypothetical protein
MIIRTVTVLALALGGSLATRAPIPATTAPNQRTAANQPTVANQRNALTGAWEVVERSYERGDSSWVNRDPEVGRYVFTERYYGVQEIRESGPRPLFTETTTELERLAAFDVFHAHGGPYEVIDDRLRIKIAIAKSPNTMSGEATFEYRLEFAGDRVRVIREVSDETRVTTLRRLE